MNNGNEMTLGGLSDRLEKHGEEAIFDWTDYWVFVLVFLSLALIGDYFGCFSSYQKTRMDTVYPERTSLLYRRPVRKKLRGNAARYRTQPVTFAEIQEVDEENLEESTESPKTTPRKSTTSVVDLNRKFDEFRKLRDKRYSKSENDSPSPEDSPVISPIKDPTAGICHPLELAGNSNNKIPGGIATPGKIIQRPSI